MNSSSLSGKTIVVTRAQSQAQMLKADLEELGANVVLCPTIDIQPVEDPRLIFETLNTLGDFDWIVFTSANGVFYTVDYLRQLGNNPTKALSTLNIAVVGPSTAEALREYDLSPDLFPETYVAESLFETFQQSLGDLADVRFLLPRSDIAREDIVQALKDAGAKVTDLTVYRTVIAEDGPDTLEMVEQLKAGQIDVITFGSSSAAIQFKERFSTVLKLYPHLLDRVALAAIGPITGRAVEEQYGHVDIEAEIHTMAGLVDAIQHYFSNPNQKAIGA